MTHIEAMKQARSVISSINAGKNNALRKNNETVFWQREEWVRWALDEVLPVLNQAIAEAEKENALQALHNENEKLGLYKDAYAEQEPVACEKCGKAIKDGKVKCVQGRNCWVGQQPAPQRTEQEPMCWEDACPNKQACCDAETCLYRHPPKRTEQEPQSVRERWNIERDGDDLLVCFNDHDKSQACTYARYVPEQQRTEQEPVIDKSAAIRIATALGWEPKREWAGLTDEQIDEIWRTHLHRDSRVRAIEAKLKQKNGYAEEKNNA